MTSFLDFLHHRFESGGFTTEDALASFLPLLRQVVATHRAGQVAPLEGINDLQVEGVRIWYEEARVQPSRRQTEKISELQKPLSRALEVVGESHMTADVDHGEETLVSVQIGKRGEEISRPVYLPGYVSWEQEVGHHDPLTDTFSLGMVLASLTCGLDLNDPEDLAEFVRHRRNLFDLNVNLHPVLAKAVARMTELDRHRRPQDLSALLRALENYRDQDIDFEFDLARLRELKAADPRGKRELILSRLQQRLFEISRRNRLLHFRPTMQTVNLTWASVPLSFDVNSIRPEQILTWNPDFQRAVVSGKPIALNKYLRFEEAIYLPSLLDEIRNEVRRDQGEFGFAQLRLALCFLRWSNLKEKPPERFDSPLVLLPVQLTKTKGVRDVYSLEPLSTEAEVNPILRHCLRQLYAVDLPEQVDLTTTPLDALHEFLVAKIQSSEPAITIEKIDRPRIQLIHARARRRLDQYLRRVRLSGRGIRAFLDVDYSYDPDNFHPLGLRLFQTRIRPPETRLRSIVAESPRPRTFIMPPSETPVSDKERLLFTTTEEETNPYRWEFDLCGVTLGNFRYRKMSLVRDYSALMENYVAHPGFEAIFSPEPRPARPVGQEPPPLEESYPIVACDPTQASAIGFAHTGKDYIIQGPPGTGKSQTITNLIADYVIRGKRVLFVCEKRAAIDVVYHRLRQVALHPLCCLIHDSQADKKEFIMDLKQTYEGYLDSQGKQASAEEVRRKLLDASQQELAPLQRFHDAMRSAPPQAMIPLRQLLHRAVELRDQTPELNPRELERIPPYALWPGHGERITRLTATLEEVHGSPVLADHPLKLLTSRLIKDERPLESVSKRLETVEKMLDTVETGLQTGHPPGADTLEKVLGLVRYSAELQFLAERNQLALLRPESELARKLASLKPAHQAKARELARAQEATKFWRQKLPPEEVKTALDQARGLQRSVFSFLKPAWWRLRGTLKRCYHFRAHAVKPTWTQVLEALQKEYEVLAGLAELEAQARDHFGFDGDFAQLTKRLAEVQEQVDRLPAAVQTFYQHLLDAPSGDGEMLKLVRLMPAVEQLQAELADLLEDGRELTFSRLRDELGLIEESLGELPDFLPCLGELAALPRELAVALRRWPEPVASLEAAMAHRSLADIFRADRGLARLNGQTRLRHVRRLEQTYEQLHEANAASVRECVRRRFLENARISSLPHAQLNRAQKEFKTAYSRGRRELEHEFGKTMRYKSIRDLLAGSSGFVIQDLKPIWLMSPLSVADALPLDATPFDVVIFDEASQVTLEEAVPSIFRAKQVIVVGDEMQLPPTNFFSAKQVDEEETLRIQDEEGEAVEYDLSSNSFLSQAARNLPATMLGGHYRSRSESLISFSNAAFYQGRLLTVPEATFPATNLSEIRVQAGEEGKENVARLLERPVSFHFLEHGVYQQRRNAAEADYIAHLVHGLLMREAGLSIGIVAFSEAQQEEIQDALDRLSRTDRAFCDRLEAEFEREQDGQFIGLLVKNLENIQGDERDVVILSVCYGYGPNGKMLMNFGPINQNGGERRLNVAFSRAKQHMALVSSIHHHAITNDYNDGARCLKNYLRYTEAASNGQFSTVQRVLREMAVREEPQAAEAAADAVTAELTDALRQRGYHVDTAVGQSSFRCDLALRRDGDRTYRLGILVDTDDYYRHSNLLEHEVLRPKLLRAFGWTVAHVLTKDWLENRNGILEWLQRLASGEENKQEEGMADEGEEAPLSGSPAAEPEVPAAPQRDSPETPEAAPVLVAAPLPAAPIAPDASATGAGRYFEFVGGTSRKFWEITVGGNQHTVRFGRIGAEGQSKTKTFPDAGAAERDARRLIHEKLGKGYVEKS